MSLVVEDGTGLSTAESYISVTDASTYHTAKGNAAWAALASDTVREQMLRKATDYMEQIYRPLWAGYRMTGTQALSWPRDYVPMEVSLTGNLYYDNDSIPTTVANACAELALKESSSDLLADEGRRTLREKISVLEVDYDPSAATQTRYIAVDMMLDKFFKISVTGSYIGLVRQ